MKPIYILNFLLTVFALLLVLIIFFPDDGIKVNDELTLKFPSFEDVFTLKKVEYADISDIIEQHQSIIDSVYINNNDSVNPDNKIDTVRFKADSLIQVIHKLEFPNNDKSILNNFFSALVNLKNNNELIRILHYGDSQIEGDRISSYLRNKFQKRFGGSGPGMLPAIEKICQSASINRYASGNWVNHSIFFKKDTILSHRRFGALTSFARFVPYNNDSINNNEKIYEAYISVEKSNISYKSVRNFNQFRMFYGFNKYPVDIEFYVDGNLSAFETLTPGKKLKYVKWNFEKSFNNLQIKFKGKDSPDVFAIALDNKSGIALDNIALRGSSGTDFTRTNLYFMKEMYDILNVKLLIIQFGVNVVPHIVKDYTYYEKRLYRQLVALKQMNPKIPIIVVSVSDMSKKEKDYYVSYPNIEKIRNAQKNAAFKANCAFWDMYEAMGGKNSMPSWVFAQPPLAQKDFVHFSYRGSKIISQMFYNAIMYEYNFYLTKKSS
ncbi:MAG: hypothetical protein KAT68_05095 [Bacteroidales bacterium]|nr:hypothetical protein [Bacteroidales bacterium]